jgi:hypothetical protein
MYNIRYGTYFVIGYGWAVKAERLFLISQFILRYTLLVFVVYINITRLKHTLVSYTETKFNTKI